MREKMFKIIVENIFMKPFTILWDQLFKIYWERGSLGKGHDTGCISQYLMSKYGKNIDEVTLNSFTVSEHILWWWHLKSFIKYLEEEYDQDERENVQNYLWRYLYETLHNIVRSNI